MRWSVGRWCLVAAAAVLCTPARVPAQIELTGTPGKPFQKVTLPQGVSGKGAYWVEAKLEKPILLRSGPALRPDIPALAYQEPSKRSDQPKDLVYLRPVGVTILPAGEIAKAITDQTGVKVSLQANWTREKVVLPKVATPARDLMDSLRAAFPGQWWKAEDTWILALSPTEADLTLLPKEERTLRHRRAIQEFMRSIGASDWRALASRRPVSLNRLSLTVQRTLMADVRLDYWDPSLEMGVPGLPAMKGQLTVMLTGSGKTASLSVSEMSRAQERYESIYGFYDPESGGLLWGVAPPS